LQLRPKSGPLDTGRVSTASVYIYWQEQVLFSLKIIAQNTYILLLIYGVEAILIVTINLKLGRPFFVPLRKDY